jgi:uncharacterized repeat protein (TIGR03803 family)
MVMRIRICRFYTFTVISLLWLFGVAVQAGAQDNNFNHQSESPKLEGEAEAPHTPEVKAAGASYVYSVLYNFCSVANCTDGRYPYGGVVRDAAGNLYGTTEYGGANTGANNGYGAGTVFKLDHTAHETVLYSFCSASNCTDGQNPHAGLIRDGAGNLYGTTVDGGANFDAGYFGGGTLFKVDKTGQETVLYSFCSAPNCTDGFGPDASLIRDFEGNLYGVTYQGENTVNSNYPPCPNDPALGCGTVFKLDRAGQETVLYGFCSAANCTDGALPYGSLFRDATGNLYGTTGNGGANDSGTVFKIDSTGQYTVLYSFCSAANCADGGYPGAGLIQDAAGNLYGTTAGGGNPNSSCPSYGCGTVFELNNRGQESVRYSFCSAPNCADGEFPGYGSLVMDSAGNLYGTTYRGGNSNSVCGSNGCGTVFKLDNTDQETVLYSFCSAANCTDGFGPLAGLIQDATGSLYGTTICGGANAEGVLCDGAGTVFKLALVGSVSITLTSSVNPSFVNQSVTFSVVVSGDAATPTGSVTFEEGTTVLGIVYLADGQASFTKKFTKSGTDSITASYSGDKNYEAANSKVLLQVINQYTTSTALTSSLNPSTFGQAVTLTATVSSAGPTPTGKVTFRNGSTWLGDVSLSGGVASITESSLPFGTLTMTASYTSDAAHAKSTSPALTQVVNQATSTTTVVSSVNPSNAGKTVKFTATVTSPTTTPTGTVTFMDGAVVLGTKTLAKGTTNYSTSTLSAGSHNITAVYEGTANIIGSTSPVLEQTVN